MPYPYGMYNAPTVGNGLGGLPRRAAPRGESLYALPGTYTWVCPVGVTSVSVLVIGGGGSGYTSGGQDGGLSRATFGATVVQADGGAQGNQFSSGTGGAGGTATGGDVNYTGGNGGRGGGGGAAGYAGNGGNAGSAGTGGSGGGGDNGNATGGGGVGVFGQGTSGAVGSAVNTTGGGGGSGGQTALYGHAGSFGGGGGGGAVNSAYYGGGGGGLAYKNNILVTPGASYTIVVGLGGRTTQANGANNGKGGDGVVRIIWPGLTRTFPSTDVNTP